MRSHFVAVVKVLLMPQTSLKKQSMSAFVWKLLERAGNQLVQIVVQIVMARLLAPEQFGALAIILVFVNLGNVFVQSGLPTAIIQTPRLESSDASTAFWLSLSISVVLYILIFAFAPVVADVYRMPYLVWPLRALTLILVINALNSVQVALIQRSMEFRKIFNATMWSVLVSATVGIGSAFAGAGLWALVLQQLSFQIVNCFAHFIQLDWRPRFEFSVNRAKVLFGFGWKLLASGILDQGYQSLSDLIIGGQFNASKLGLVSQGKKYPAAVGSLLDGAIQPVMLSAVSKTQMDLDKVKSIVRRALKMSCFCIVPSMTLFAIAARPLISLLLGDKWLSCVPFLQMYCVVYMLLPIHTTNLQALNGLGRSDLFLRLELIKKAIGLINLLVMAFVFHNIYLIVFSYIFTGILSTFINAAPNKWVIGYSYAEQLRDIAPAFLISFVSGLCAYSVVFLNASSILTIVLEILVMAFVYFGISKLLHFEAFDYLVITVRDYLDAKRN